MGKIQQNNSRGPTSQVVFDFRLYNRSLPTLIITDPNIIAEVMIKKFDIFPHRFSMPNVSPKYFRKNITILQGEEWKKVRSILSPTFTGLKLKKMVPFINGIGDSLNSKFSKVLETESQEFELKPMFRACTMDIICNIVFGIEGDSEVSKILEIIFTNLLKLQFKDEIHMYLTDNKFFYGSGYDKHFSIFLAIKCCQRICW